MSKYTEAFQDMIITNERIMNDLRLVRDLGLPESYIAAGYVRNYIWDRLHGYTERTALNDIDVIYYNPAQLDEEIEKHYENQLKQMTGCHLWSVKNQARMHLRNGNAPYESVEDAISHWPENVTAVAVRLEEDDTLSWLCPYGLDDIFEFRIRRSPLFKDEAYYRSRIVRKNWKELWSLLEIH